MEKPADTKYPIHDLLKRRWSPRSFSDRAVEPQKIRRLFEAARWAASSFNEQPWRFIVATKDDPAAYAKALGCLVEKNQAWAKLAPVLMLTVTRDTFTRNNNPNRVALHDLGLAMGNLTVEATSLGLVLHQMAGVDTAKVIEAYQVPAGYTAQTAIALGYPGEPAALPEEWMRTAEVEKRDRKPFDEFVFGDQWGKPTGWF